MAPKDELMRESEVSTLEKGQAMEVQWRDHPCTIQVAEMADILPVLGKDWTEKNSICIGHSCIRIIIKCKIH